MDTFETKLQKLGTFLKTAIKGTRKSPVLAVSRHTEIIIHKFNVASAAYKGLYSQKTNC